MNSNKKTGRIAGALLLFTFISGVIIFQVLQSSVLSSKDFSGIALNNENNLILSTILGTFSGIASIIVSILLLPIFKKQHYNLAFLYVAFCIVNFVAIMIDNHNVLEMLEFSKAFAQNANEASNSLNIMKTVLSEKHLWTHYFYLLISTFPVFVLYYTLFVSKLVPKILSVFGLIAVLLMFIQITATIFGKNVSGNIMLPMALIQLVFPIWLIIKGLKAATSTE
ncbi:uncharacterized protein DUF4386 [Lutibacter sp. Hel_I_33_5]|uniref:DUF4386 domain-containing protein n=1 Tax=Lutibacter sp. Hel_I_33_5 TaxID=1566289 RepID=UPI0011A98EFE|nr:DUF4386 domain-containing protein [Lutibacter sp. Hel_I_33_5]TVZ56443.1 uncharacterized protein DUF4386 [Lutibacter sp. Hel_I_33_5]